MSLEVIILVVLGVAILVMLFRLLRTLNNIDQNLAIAIDWNAKQILQRTRDELENP